MHLSEKDWQKLLRTIERGTCVLMLGADIPSDLTNTIAPPATTLLARQLALQIGNTNKYYDPDDLPQVAQTYLNQRIGDRDDLEMAVESFYQDFQHQTTKLHQCLAQLPIRYCISITPDAFMLNAFKQANKSTLQGFYHFRSGNRILPDTSDSGHPLLYNLYGSLNDSRSLVLSETDLLDFLANIIAGCPELPPSLSKLFSDPNTSFLFIGFGFHRWYWRIVLHLFRKQLNTKIPWSLALEDDRFFSDPLYQQTALFYDHTHAIEFKHCSWNELAEGLLNRFQATQSATSELSESSLPKNTPTVFLCHCSKDSEAVEKFGATLRARGINTWRDRDNLRGGEDWDRRIKHLIENNQIDYFLVLQTPSMLAESQSYFVKEIQLALERQKQNLPGFLFIIPIILAGTDEKKLEILSHLNFLDLRNNTDLDRLILSIQDDKEKRLNRKALATEEWDHAN